MLFFTLVSILIGSYRTLTTALPHYFPTSAAEKCFLLSKKHFSAALVEHHDLLTGQP
jgi:hypothetical protein